MADFSSWANKRILNINPSNVDEDLTDFPVMIHLSNFSGNNIADMTDVFDQLETTVTGSNHTTLLLHMNDTSLSDSSDFRHITSVTNAVRSSAQSKFGGYSAYFDGTGGYLSILGSAGWDFEAGDFTVDFWAYMNTITTTDFFFDSNISTGRLLINVYSTYYQIHVGGTNANSTVTPTTGGWNHFALVRNAGDCTLYKDGISIINFTSTDAVNISEIVIGARYSKDGYWLDGYIDEFRILKGKALWTSNFTPPTGPYNNPLGTYQKDIKLLLHMDDAALSDSSSSNHAIVNSGGVTVTGTQSVFGSYSAYFDGSSTYFTTQDSDDWDFGTGDFTVDLWVRPESVSGARDILNTQTSTYGGFDLLLDAGKVVFSTSNGGSSPWHVIDTGTFVLSVDIWYHIAVVRQGTDIKIYVDGVERASGTNGDNITSAKPLWFGRHVSLGRYFSGYMDEIRISKGISKWTADFVPPTSPYKSSYGNRHGLAVTTTLPASYDSNIVLLMHMDDTSLSDSSNSSHTTTLNGTSRSVTQSKFGGYSASFNGSSNYISMADNTDWDFGTDNWTIDFWLYVSSYSTDACPLVMWGVGAYGSNVNDHNWMAYLDGSGDLRMRLCDGGTSTLYSTGDTVGTGAWHHIAFTYDGTYLRQFIDGDEKSEDNVAGLDIDSDTYALEVGRARAGASAGNLRYLNGYIDELRIVKGKAMWTNDFGPPTKPYTFYDSESGEIELYTEIEHWDHDAQEAWLWTKVPTVASGSNTTLTLYYDATQSGTRIGDTGTTNAQNVWDDNFRGVWHMEQEPITGSYTVFDSTGNLDCRPYNTSSSDMVKSEIGYGYNFGESNEYLYFGNTDIGTKYTFSTVFKFDSATGTPMFLSISNSNYGCVLGPMPGSNYFYMSDNNEERTVAYTGWDTNWHHFAVIRNDTNATVYVDGVAVGSITPFGSNGSISPDNIGAAYNSGSRTVDGEYTNATLSIINRSAAWVKAEYYASFDSLIHYYEPTGSTTWQNGFTLTIDDTKVDEDLYDFPVLINVSSGTGQTSYDASAMFDNLTTSGTYDDYTKLLVRPFGDASASKHDVSFRNGVTLKSSPSKFNKSIYIAGQSNGNYVAVPADSDWNFGTDDFTIDYWIRFDDYVGSSSYDYQLYWNSANYIRQRDNGKINIKLGGSAHDETGTTLNSNDVWFHIAIVRNSGTVKVYVDGVEVPGISFSPGSLDLSSVGFYLGSGGGYYMDGYIEEFRISKGIARWTTTFSGSLPTEQYSPDDYTVFLLHPDGELSSSNHDLIFAGNSNITTGTGPLHTGNTIYFDGAGDNIRIYDHTDFDFGSDDFTFDMWVMFDNVSGNDHFFNRWLFAGGDWYFIRIGTEIRFGEASWGTIDTSGAGIQANVWYHLAAVRHGNQLLIFINGQLSKAQTISGSLTHTASRKISIGRIADSDVDSFQGYMSEVRISKGIARWTTNFTPENYPYGVAQNRKKIFPTMTYLGEEIYLPAEIELWDQYKEEAWLWTRIPLITSSGTTSIGLYYDATLDNNGHIGDTGEDAAKRVWDSGFLCVYHMSRTPDRIIDSTNNSNNLSSGGSMTDADLVDGKTGKAIHFDGSDDYLHVAMDNLNAPITMEGVFYYDQLSQSDYDYTVMLGADNMSIMRYNNDDFSCYDGSSHRRWTSIPGQTWCHISVVAHTSSDYLSLFFDGEEKTLQSQPSSAITTNGDLTIGEYYASHSNQFDGISSEVRLSNVDRSASWNKATYYSNWNNLITFSDYSATFINFIFSNPYPLMASTVYGLQQLLKLTVTVTGNTAPSYSYDAEFYNATGDVKIGTTISGSSSGSQVTKYIDTSGGGGTYSWYVKATSSGSTDTSITYNFTNRYLCSGYAEVNSVRASGIPIRLYRRSSGELVGYDTTTGVSGTFEIPTDYNEYHYGVALYTDDTTNALIYDFLTPSGVS